MLNQLIDLLIVIMFPLFPCFLNRTAYEKGDFYYLKFIIELRKFNSQGSPGGWTRFFSNFLGQTSPRCCSRGSQDGWIKISFLQNL